MFEQNSLLWVQSQESPRRWTVGSLVCHLQTAVEGADPLRVRKEFARLFSTADLSSCSEEALGETGEWFQVPR